MKTLAIVQARMGSTRLPNKVMLPMVGIPMIGCLLQRLKRAETLDHIVLATATGSCNQPLVEYVQSLGIETFQGNEDDVLDRYYQATSLHQPHTVVRITGDCPLMDPELVDRFIRHFEAASQATGVDYLSNKAPATYPDGLDIEVFTFEVLEKAWQEAKTPYEREHVTPFLRESGQFRCDNIEHDQDLSGLRWTVDEPDDVVVIERVFQHFAPNVLFGWLDVLALEQSHPDWFVANKHLIRDEGATLGKGPKLWKRAKRVIPGGNMLLSKRAEMFLPDQWPAYFSKAQGCQVWDLDDRMYWDLSIMGIGTNVLGYGHPKVDEAVRNVVAQGNMSTFNCPEEVWLAERLVELHPWAEQVRLARTGGEANAIAIRIARAASGRDKIAICGYHGWHDWYLAANLGGEQELAGHLLPGLTPNGVPQHLKESVLTFRYNQLQELEALIAAHDDIGVIKMEVSRNEPPLPGFLESVRSLATQHNMVLVFDECTSGFRETFGGLHKKYGVEPDLAVFGKALGNGYAITAVLGRSEVMQAAQSTFISSTFWTERIGPAAALATLEAMEQEQSWQIVTYIGLNVQKRWQAMADYHGLKMNFSGIPALAGFAFESEHHLAYKTLITQELLKKGFLAGNCLYACTEHSDEVLEQYFHELDAVFEKIRDCEEGRDVEELLDGPICHGGFKRLN